LVPYALGDEVGLCLDHVRPSPEKYATFDVHTNSRSHYSDTKNRTGNSSIRVVSPAFNVSCNELQKSHFQICAPNPHRKCLLARIPWRVSLSVAQCCFSCCMQYWQRKLGMEDIYFTMKNISTIAARTDPQKKSVRSRLLKGLPRLDSVVLQEGSARRFSLVRMSNGQIKPWVMPHKSLLQRGGVITTSDGAGITHLVTEQVTEVLRNYPVSIVNQGDIAWPNQNHAASFRERNGFSIFDLPGGGKTVTVNAHSSLLMSSPKFLLSFWGVRSLQFETMLGDRGSVERRSEQFMCCCMTDRNGRAIRAASMKKYGMCKDFGSHKAGEHQTKGGRITMQEYIRRLSISKLVWSPAGHGLSTFRDLEVLLAGAIPVLDGLPGRKELFETKFRRLPVIWVPGKYCRSQHFCPSVNVTPAWLDDQWNSLMKDRSEFDVAEAFWPYWLYQLSTQILNTTW
jgi:hypothetical protein